MKLYSCPLDKQMNYEKMYYIGRKMMNIILKKYKRKILVPNAQENTPDITTDTNESDIPQVADEVISDETSGVSTSNTVQSEEHVQEK